MDLSAYAQIDDLKHYLVENNIVIDRLRGLRLMKNEEMFFEEDIQEILEEQKRVIVINWLQQHSDNCWSSEHAHDDHPAFIWDRFHEEVVDYDFSKVHGAERRAIKYRWDKLEKAVRKQFELFNKFVGKNVLYVHARQGGGNRKYYPIDTKHPMYLGDVDDYWDSTYCDIYYDLDKSTFERD